MMMTARTTTLTDDLYQAALPVDDEDLKVHVVHPTDQRESYDDSRALFRSPRSR